MENQITMNTTKTQKEYISQYEQYLMVEQAKSKNTVVNYISDLKQYFNKFDVIDRENIQAFKKEICDLSSTTINRKLSSLKSFNEYLLGLGVVDSLVIIKADFSKTQDIGNPTDVTEKQVAMFLNRVNTKQTMYKSRNIALINLIANTGIRREEATNIKLKDIDFDNYELTITSGKGNKTRHVLLNNKSVELIKIYLEDRANMKHADSPYLFISERGWKLCKDTINDIFDFYSTPKCNVRPHQLRHHFASTVIEQDVLTLPELQNQLGHSSLNVTSRYTHARKDSIRKKINKLQIG